MLGAIAAPLLKLSHFTRYYYAFILIDYYYLTSELKFYSFLYIVKMPLFCILDHMRLKLSKTFIPQRKNDCILKWTNEKTCNYWVATIWVRCALDAYESCVMLRLGNVHMEIHCGSFLKSYTDGTLIRMSVRDGCASFSLALSLAPFECYDCDEIGRRIRIPV